ncbi:MAG: carbohydrate-binding family 9-like protein, partial [Cyclobacteriaceae bacterium]
MIFFLKLIFTGFLLFYGISILFNYSIKNNYDSEDENKVYNITWVSQPINIDGFWNKEPWKNIPPLNIDKHIGNVPEHKPTVQAKVAYDNEAIYIIFRVQDKYVKCVTEQYQGSVYKDSCVEFFFTPGSDISKGYFNL